MWKRHRKQLEGTSDSQCWDNVSNDINNDNIEL